MKKYILILVMLVIIAPQAGISAQTWQQVPLRTKAQQTAGLSGGEGKQMIFSMKYAPTNANIVYFLTDTAQIWKSTNGGTSWQPAKNGFTSNGGASLMVSPFSENVVFVAGGPMSASGTNYPGSITGIWRTTDGGNNWTLVKSIDYVRRGGGLDYFAWGANANIVYAATNAQGVLKSQDGGTTWANIALSGGNVYDLKRHPTDPTILYACTSTGLKKIVDSGGVTVTNLGTGLPRVPDQIVIDKNNPSTMYVNQKSYGVYKSTDGGVTFSAINTGMSSSVNSAFLTMSSGDPNYLYVFNERLDTLFYYTHNAGSATPTWSRPLSTDEQNADGWVFGSIRGIDEDPRNGGYWDNPFATHPTDKNIALMSSGAIIKKTTDGGANWRYSNSGYTGGAASIRVSGSAHNPFSWDKNNSSRYVVFHVDIGPFLTEDNGSTFRNLRIPRVDNHISTLAGDISPTQPNMVITAIGDWETQTVAITRNVNATAPDWSVISNTGDFYQFISFHPTNSNIAYAGWFKFTNIQTNNNYTILSKKVIAMYPGNGDIVYSIEANGNSMRIYKSTNGGSTWTNPYPDLPTTYSGASVGQITVDPNNPDKLHVAVWAASNPGIYIVTPSGYTVKGSANGLTPSIFNSVDTLYVTVDPNNTEVLYAGYWRGYKGQSSGVFRSADGGNTWTNINGNLGSNFTVQGLAVNPHTSEVFVGSYHGTWKLPSVYSGSPSWTLHYVDSQETVGENGAAINAFDGNINTFWHSKWYGGSNAQPHEIQINLGEPKDIGGFKYLPRQDGGANGRVGLYEFYVSTDGSTWGSPVGTGTFANSASEKTVTFGTQTSKQYVRLKSLTEVNGNPWTSMSEINLITDEGGETPPAAPLVLTSAASNVAYTTATLNGQVNPNGLQSTYRWQYGTSPSSYSTATGSQTVATGTTHVNVSSNISSLYPGTTYYMRCQANNGEGTTNGSQLAFVTVSSPQLSYDATKTGTNTITVDGLLTDWPALTSSISKIISRSPLSSGTGSVMWNDQYIYVAVSVSDSILYDTGSTNTPWVEDGIDIYIDRDNNRGLFYDGYDIHLSRSYNNSYTWSLSGTNTGIVSAGSHTTNSYNIEMAIPWSFFPGNIVPGGGTVMGFDFQINDNNGTAGARLGAKDWNNAADTNYFNPSGFGEVVLIGTSTSEQESESSSIETITGCISHWKFDENTGTVINDSVGTRTGTATGMTWGTGKVGSAGSFDGIDDYVGVNQLIGSPTQYSMSGWCYLVGSDTTGAGLISLGDYSGIILRNYSTPKQIGFRYDGATWRATGSQTATPFNEWHHYVFSVDDTNNLQTLYIDGLYGTTSTWPANTQWSGQGTQICFGKHGDGGTTNDLNGRIDEVRVFNRAVTAQEAIDLWAIPVVNGVGTATNITSTTATILGTASTNGSISANMRVQYGLSAGVYTGTSTETNLTGSTTSSGASFSLTGLPVATTVYYRSQIYSNSYTISGTEQSFATSGTDVYAPVGTITANSGATYSNKPEVTLTLSATDGVGVVGYFVSENSDTPYGTQSGWVDVGTATNYSENIPYTLTLADGTKTVNVWYKDGAGNISNAYSDEIILDITFPSIYIVSPAYNCYMDGDVRAFGTTGSTISLAGSSADMNGITSVQIYNSATTTVSSANGNESWSLPRTIVTGTVNTFMATAQDASTNQGTVAIRVGAFPTTTTSDATNINRYSVQLNGIITANNNTTTVWFDHGLSSGAYTGSSSTQVVTGDADTAIGIALGALNKNTEYFYRIVGSNAVGLTYGHEYSFNTDGSPSKAMIGRTLGTGWLLREGRLIFGDSF